LGADLERIAVELRHLQRTEVLETQEPFSYKQTGSSSMPHKKNPVALENISGLARLLRSNLQAELENVALWHERDISHSSVERVILPDTTTLAHYMLRRLGRVLEGLVVFEENIQRNLERTRGLVYSQRVLGLLIEAGLDRTAAYEIVQRNALRSWAEGQDFRALLEADPACPLRGEALAQAFDPGYFLRHVDTIYARFGL
ncbi:MAG: lyase family protein, partial [Geminicoccaceae bacterium]